MVFFSLHFMWRNSAELLAFFSDIFWSLRLKNIAFLFTTFIFFSFNIKLSLGERVDKDKNQRTLTVTKWHPHEKPTLGKEKLLTLSDVASSKTLWYSGGHDLRPDAGFTKTPASRCRLYRHLHLDASLTTLLLACSSVSQTFTLS